MDVVGWDDALKLTDALFGVYFLLVIGHYHKGFIFYVDFTNTLLMLL